MATIVVVTNEIDQPWIHKYLLHGFFRFWESKGHRILLHHGEGMAPAGDIAILHVDQTLIGQTFLEGMDRYPVVINGAVLDISKRRLSKQLLHPGENYSGPVICKTDLNCNGEPERRKRFLRLRQDKSPAGIYRYVRARLEKLLVSDKRSYRIYDTLSAVPPGVWHSQDLVVEKFLPEQDDRGYYLRTWTFFGDREYCSRVRSSNPIVKGRHILERTAVTVPDELRDWRSRLKFDYGKFDFVMREGEVVLFDVNRTPSVPDRLHDTLQANIADLASGLAGFLKRG